MIGCNFVRGVLAIFPLLSLCLTPTNASSGLQFLLDIASNSRTNWKGGANMTSIIGSKEVSHECIKSLEALTENPKKLILYLDATGKPSSGLLTGNVFVLLGSFSQCTRMIDGAHYCTTILNAPMIRDGDRILWGVCVPQQCSEEDVAGFLDEIFSGFNRKVGIELNVKSVTCNKTSEYTTGVIITLVLCGFILFLCLAGTTIDAFLSFMTPKPLPVNQQDLPTNGMPVRNTSIALDNGDAHFVANSFGNYEQDASDRTQNTTETTALISPRSPEVHPGPVMKTNPVISFFLCFSLIQNTSRIMDTNVPAGTITSINGMRVLSMWWVILGHTFLYDRFTWLGNHFELPSILQRFSFQVLWNASFSVDSFFFLSGLLVAYVSFRHMEKRKGKLSLFKFYFHRFLRLTPTYMFVLLFFTKLTGFLGKGPLWFRLQSIPACDKYWWTNLLYINNFYPANFNDTCMGWGWYLANDMQFYLISPIILFAAYRFRLRGLLASVGFLISASFVITALIYAHYDLAPVMSEPSPHDGQSLVYEKPYCRIAPYLVGMTLGYVLQYKKNFKSSKFHTYMFNVTGWCVAIVLALSTVYGPYKTKRKEEPEHFTRAENIVYGTFARFAWSLSLAWVVFACNRGLGGVVNKILSARFWTPLSRLTYCAYLVHLIVIFTLAASTENLQSTYSDVHLAYIFAGVLTISYAAAFIVSACVEFPVMQLENLIFKRHN